MATQKRDPISHPDLGELRWNSKHKCYVNKQAWGERTITLVVTWPGPPERATELMDRIADYVEKVKEHEPTIREVGLQDAGVMGSVRALFKMEKDQLEQDLHLVRLGVHINRRGDLAELEYQHPTFARYQYIAFYASLPDCAFQRADSYSSSEEM